jgi:predicted transcriptional regulator
VVIDDDNVVHGLLAKGDIPNGADSHVVQDVMRLGPVTIRPSRSLESAVSRMDQLDTDSVLVTTECGELLGVLYREDAQNHLEPVRE